jgi:hypothetical protein
MGSALVIGLLWGGGIVLALIFMVIASLAWDSEGFRRTLYWLTFFALLAQGGCWYMAEGIGRALGGGGDSRLQSIVLIAGGVAFVWALVLEWIDLMRWKKQRRK